MFHSDKLQLAVMSVAYSQRRELGGAIEGKNPL